MYDVLAEVAGVIADDETVVERASGGFTEYLGLDARRPPFDDVRIRRAVAHAIDRDSPALTRGLGGTAASTGGLLPASMPGHSHRVTPSFDLGRARALLTEAGHPEGRGVAEVVLTHWGHWEDVASEIGAQLSEIGIRVRRLPAHSYAELTAAIESRAHAYIWAWAYESPDPGSGFLQPLLTWGTWLTVTSSSKGCSGGLRRSTTRTSVSAPSASSSVSGSVSTRPWRCSGTGPHALAAPLAHRDVGERHR